MALKNRNKRAAIGPIEAAFAKNPVPRASVQEQIRDRLGGTVTEPTARLLVVMANMKMRSRSIEDVDDGTWKTWEEQTGLDRATLADIYPLVPAER